MFSCISEERENTEKMRCNHVDMIKPATSHVLFYQPPKLYHSSVYFTSAHEINIMVLPPDRTVVLTAHALIAPLQDFPTNYRRENPLS
jgi:hypothetical protein